MTLLANTRINWFAAAVALLGLALCACSPRAGSDLPISLTPAIAPLQPGWVYLSPGGDYRLNTVRRIGGADILCSEPSPDWANALTTSRALAASGGANGASGSLNLSSTTAEVIAAMAGRTAGVVALRDGLYAACQAYANGIIGKDAYSLVLSQYGNLLVALAGGGSGGGGAATPASSTPAGVAVAVSTGTAQGGSAPAPSGAGSSAMSAQVAAMQQEAVQAMIVACINEGDNTVDRTRKNTFLSTTFCNKVLDEVATAIGPLLKAPSTSNPPATRPTVRVAASRGKPAPAAAGERQTPSRSNSVSGSGG